VSFRTEDAETGWVVRKSRFPAVRDSELDLGVSCSEFPTA